MKLNFICLSTSGLTVAIELCFYRIGICAAEKLEPMTGSKVVPSA